MPLAEFIILCGTLQVPVLREPPGGLEAELAGLEAALGGQRHTAGHRNALPEIAPVPHGDRGESIRYAYGPDSADPEPLSDNISDELEASEPSTHETSQG